MARSEERSPGPRKIRRLPYILWTAGLLAVAYLLLRIVLINTAGGPGRYPGPWQFLDPLGLIFSTGGRLYWTLIIHAALTVAFVLSGMWRARDAGWKTWIGALMAVPVVRLFVFTALAMVPGRMDPGQHELARSPFLDRILPVSKRGSAVAAILFAIAVMLPLGLLKERWLQNYGLALFIGLPFLLGVTSAFLYGYHHQRTVGASLGVAALAMSFALLVIFLIAMEGVVCLLMAVPVAYPVALMGALVGHALSHGSHGHVRAMVVVVLLVPGLMGFETAEHQDPPVYSVTTKVLVHAPAQRIWDSMIAFSRIAPPTELLFKAGISYPTEARIEGTGVGACRYCQFNTGPFVEPITTWDEPHLLAFNVEAEPPSMVELSIYDHINAPHVNGFFRSRHGEIRLRENPDGTTLLEGTTWYTHDIWPTWYWKIWSDAILHRIHERVLNHIKSLSEKDR